MRGRIGAYAAHAVGGNIHLRRFEFGPTQEQIDRVTQLAIADESGHRTASSLELEAHARGSELLRMAIPAGIPNRDYVAVQDRVYQITIKRRGIFDDVADRIASAHVETGAREVIAWGGDAQIEPGQVSPETLQHFINDFPAIAQLFSRRAVEHVFDEHNKQTGHLQHVMVSTRQAGQGIVEKHENLILTSLGFGLAAAVPPLAVLGVPLAIDAAVGGVAALVARTAIGAKNDDLERHQRAEQVRAHTGPQVRAKAIQDLNVWAQRMIEEPTSKTSHPRLQLAHHVLVSAMASVPKVRALA